MKYFTSNNPPYEGCIVTTPKAGANNMVAGLSKPLTAVRTSAKGEGNGAEGGKIEHRKYPRVGKS